MEEFYRKMRLMEIEQEIKKAEHNKNSGVVMMVVSIFFLWPLLIVGLITYSNANKRINDLNDEKRRITFENMMANNEKI